MVKPNLPHWQATALWRAITKKHSRHAIEVRKILETWMTSIELVLAKGGTSPLKFTLHDDDHAYRVAQTMVDVMPKPTAQKLSVYELALLLLSAYLHDIGMTPGQGRVFAHYELLLTGDSMNLGQADKNHFQGWLDEEGRGTGVPICKGTPTSADLALAEELTANYCRHRHNEWSESWIRENSPGLKLGHYADWLEDLVALCRSHHQGYSELIADRFNVRIAAETERMNLRYLAAVLRVADVLENDPERTPEVILRHRRVQGESLIHWYKPHAMSTFVKSDHVTVTARPLSARGHKAVLDTIAQIDEELEVCRRLADEGRFAVGLSPTSECPKWTLPGRVVSDVRPSANAYVFIDGSFRPDTEKVLHLLGGIELYRNPLVAVREILSNAFDAVREKIAHKRLRLPNPASDEHEGNLGQLESVELKLEISADGAWIVCRDSGVGMSKAIIENYLLVSGRSIRTHVAELARQANKSGFPFVRSGQFGIGVLSFFMLADKVVIRTRRCQECGEGDTEGWTFESEGIGTFGELRRCSDAEPGTEVRLQLRPSVVGDLGGWYSLLVGYIRSILVKIPCRLTVGATLPSSESLTAQTGWMLNSHDIAEVCLNRAPQYPYGRHGDLPRALLPSAERMKREEAERHWSEMLALMRPSLRFKVEEGQLPEATGTYRLHVPYFELTGGNCLLFARPLMKDDHVSLQRVGDGYAATVGGEAFAAWRGVKIDLDETEYGIGVGPRLSFNREVPVITEINFESSSAAKIGVDRHSIELKNSGKEAMRTVEKHSKQLVARLVSDNIASTYATINRSFAKITPSPARKYDWCWLTDEYAAPGNPMALRPMKFPVTSVGLWSDHRLFFRGSPLISIPRLRTQSVSAWGDGLFWTSTLSPSMVGFWEHSNLERPLVVPVWNEPVSQTEHDHPAGGAAAFPPSWSRVCGITINTLGRILNRDHRLLKLVDRKAWEWSQQFQEKRDPLLHQAQLVNHPELAAAWLLRTIYSADSQFWRGVRDRDPKFLPQIWETIFGNEAKDSQGWISVVVMTQGEEEPGTAFDESTLEVVSPEVWTKYDSPDEYSPDEFSRAFIEYFPRPSADFRIDYDTKPIS